MLFKKVNWQKHGLVVLPDSSSDWRHSHAMLPTPLKIHDTTFKIFFASRNKLNQSFISYAIIDIANPTQVLEYSSAPVVSPGRLGTFDDNGVLPSCALHVNDQLFLYTIGFKPGGTTRMDLFGGLTISKDEGKTFSRWSEAPILERNRVNPFINTAPWVVYHVDKYMMYYVSGVEWIHKDLPRYNIQIATSLDGLDWSREGQVVIDFKDGENALARPYVLIDNGIFRMWFSAKGQFYLPCYAESTDGFNWERYDDAVTIKPTKNGPDDEMICYPVVLKNRDQHIMFYNGNGYGKNGICLATEI